MRLRFKGEIEKCLDFGLFLVQKCCFFRSKKSPGRVVSGRVVSSKSDENDQLKTVVLFVFLVAFWGARE